MADNETGRFCTLTGTTDNEIDLTGAMTPALAADDLLYGVRQAAEHGEVTWVSKDGERIGAIVPAGVAEFAQAPNGWHSTHRRGEH
jgi:hypothetical protein